MNHNFYQREQVTELEEQLRLRGFSCDYDFEKHRLDLTKPDSSATANLRLPFSMTYPEVDKDMLYLMLLVQSGSAAVGVFEGEKCLSHKVFSAYMVRKKQGKSQIKHLKTKGKSRAGSRVRLAKTLEFFEDINTRLQGHCETYNFDRIALSCSKILIPYLFGSKVDTPFEKKDDLIYKIPKHLHQPNYEVLLGMQRFLNKAELTFEEQYFPELNELL